MLCSTCCSDQVPTCSSFSPTRNSPLFWLGTAPFHAPAGGCAIPNPQGGSSLFLPQAGLPQHQENCLAPGNLLLIISSGTHSSINTWSTKSVPSSSSSALKRGMSAQMVVDTKSVSSWSWTSVIWASEYHWVLPLFSKVKCQEKRLPCLQERKKITEEENTLQTEKKGRVSLHLALSRIQDSLNRALTSF